MGEGWWPEKKQGLNPGAANTHPPTLRPQACFDNTRTVLFSMTVLGNERTPGHTSELGLIKIKGSLIIPFPPLP